ncbi:MAG: tRNA (N6-isopentenyl adenosine(37)-C2)-methylthiotransferase MiaB [Thermovirgaceae bacterium]
MFRFAIHVYGCQMNVYDADRLRTSLLEKGWEEVAEDAADIVLFVTCSIRAKAEQKVWSEIGRLEHLHRSREAPLVAVVGCMGQRLGKAFLNRFSNVRLVAGPRSLGRVPDGLEQVTKGGKPLLIIDDPKGLDDLECAPVRRENHWKAFLTIAHGCDNFCTYCIVPYVRGRFRSRDPGEILNEVRELAADGVREISLIGQNVNSYGADFENGYSFASLLRDVAAEKLVDRIRFYTSHPKDFTPDIVEAMRDNQEICPAINLPIQSGSDRILKAMRRGYSLEEYATIVEMIRKGLPESAVTSDLIVGFPGETEEDFKASVQALKRFRFDLLHSAAYSPREGTVASLMEDQVPACEKKRRLNEVNGIQMKISAEINAALVGRTFEILVDGPAPKGEGLLQGRTVTDKVVIVEGPESLLGRLVQVRIDRAGKWYLHGSVLPRGNSDGGRFTDEGSDEV